MSKPEDQMRAVIDKVTAEWADKGKVIEGGWQALLIVADLTAAPELQRSEMRKAYFAGAQHLFASIMGILDSDAEPTAKDLRRMSLIQDELEAFRISLTS